MKQKYIILFLAISVRLSGQWLFDLRRTHTGSVVAVAQETPLVTVPEKSFTNQFPDLRCLDSIFIERSDMEGAPQRRECVYDFNFSNSYFPTTNVIKFDPFKDEDIDVNKNSGTWWRSGKYAWSYQRKNSLRLNDYTNLTWEFDESGRLMKITDWYKDTIQFSQEYFYGLNNNLNRLTKTHYQRGSLVYINHQQWFEDSNGRVSFRIDYSGNFRPYTNEQLNELQSKILLLLSSSKQVVDSFLKVLHVQLVAVYKYGRHGLEVTNACFRGDRYCNTDRLSDSLFYDRRGRIKKFKGYFSSEFAPLCVQTEFLFDYNKTNDQLVRVEEHRYHNPPYADRFHFKIVQTFFYGKDRRVSHVNEKRSTIWRQYVDGKHNEGSETINDEIDFHYKYKY